MLPWLLIACDPCAHWDGTEIVDDDGLVNEATQGRMRETIDTFYAWTGAADVCVDRVAVDEQGDPYTLSRWPADRIVIDASYAVSDYWLRRALCDVLDHRRGYTEILGEDFVATCGLGPRHYDWADEIIAACGTTHLTSLDAAVRDQVWTHADLGRPHGHLGVEIGPTYALEGLAPEGGGVGGAAAADDRLALVVGSGEDGDPELEVVLLDPATGELFAAAPVDETGALYPAPGGVLLDAVRYGGDSLTTIDVDGRAHSVVLDERLPGNGQAATRSRFYSAWPAWDEVLPMAEVDLSTGDRREIDLPGPKGMYPAAYPLLGLDEQLLVKLIAAEVDADCGGFDCVVTVTTFDQAYNLYDPEAGTWTEVGRDFYFAAAGVTADGLAMGSFEVDAGSVYAAWDPATGEMWASDEVCAEEHGRLSLVVGDVAYRAWGGADGRSLVLQPMALSLD